MSRNLLLYHIKLTLRGLKRNSVYSTLSILGFTVGLAVCLVKASLVVNP